MNNQVVSDKAIGVIVFLAVGGIIFFTNGTALGFASLDIISYIPNIITPQETVSEPIIEIVPEPVIEVVPEPVIEIVPEPVIEVVPEPVIEAVPEPPKPKTINLNELTESDGTATNEPTPPPKTEPDDTIAPPFKTFKEEVTWYEAFSRGKTPDIPQECDPVIRLYKQTTELYAKASLAETILEVCNLD